MREVAHEARVVDRADRADAHRTSRELPEIGHEVRMWVAAQAVRALAGGRGWRGQLLAVVAQVFSVQASFQKSSGIYAW